MKVSIAFLSYNHVAFVGAALRSALNQNYPEYELIIHDDGSNDGTLQVIEDILAKEVPAHIRIIMAGDGKNHGLIESFNRAMTASTGEIIMHISGDDISCQNRLSRAVEIFKKFPDVMLVVSEAHRIDDSGNFVAYSCHATEDSFYSYDKKPSHIYAKAPILGAAASYRACVIKDFPLITAGHCHAEDNVYWVRALLKGRIYNIAEPLLCYRFHENNFSENGWKWATGLSDNLKASHLEFVRKHGLNFLQWEIDILHAKQRGFINEAKAAVVLRTARADALRWSLLFKSLNVKPWSEWLHLGLESIKIGGIKVAIGMLKLRLSPRRRSRYWSRHLKSIRSPFGV
jgi:glycosyltransferase involved in cell wall biosynthesis